MKKVNLFLVGAQKSGSTALAEYLSQHNEIEVSMPKAPNYFSELFVKAYSIKKYKQYKQCFKKDAKYLCDASDCYHADIEALKKIKAYNSNAKIIMVLRNPYSMLGSLHDHLIWAGYENIEDLNAAWAAQLHRKVGELVPKYCPSTSFLDYHSLCSIGQHCKNILNIFYLDNVFFVKTTELKKNPTGVMKSITDFLELDEIRDVKKVSSNESVKERLKILTVLNRKFPSFLKVKIKNIFMGLGVNLDGKFRSLNGVKLIKSNVDYPFSKDIKCSFNKDIELLSECAGKAVLDWKL
jgi:hypothetical protein